MTPNDVKIVADNIDDFIEVPNGIEKLRQAVLTLAVSGKIVPQTKSEKITEDISASTKTETPFDIPKSWKWVNFADVFDIHGGTQPPKKDFIYEPKQGYVRLLQIRDFGERGVPTYVRVESVRRFCKPEDILIGRYGASVGRICSGMEGAYNVALAKVDFLHSSIEREYTKIYFLQDYFQSKLLAISRSAQAGFNKEDLSKFVFPYPPETEQKRIVKKVQEVMRQLDELETKKRERDEVRTRLARSAMHSLGKGESKIAFEQLSELIKTPADIKELEGALLTLAVSGKLVPQDKSDGTAEELYAKIRSERSSSARKRKTQELQLPKPTETSFDIPKSWKWIRLGDCMDISSGDSLKVSEATEGKYLVYGGNGIAGRHTESNASKGTIVIGRVGALCGIAHITETDAWVTDNAFIVSYPEKFLDRHFFALLLNQLNLRKSHRGSAQPVISGISVYPIPMPLPPLVEQKRIVKKVEEVMVLINRLRRVIGEK
jgi:type I restriction enzyme S subunit